MNWVTLVSMFVEAVAMVVIAVFTWLNYKMYVKLQEREEQQQQRFQDLLEGNIIATLISGPSSTGEYKGEAKKLFLEEYKGKTEIFKR
jgi:hypothetical protein